MDIILTYLEDLGDVNEAKFSLFFAAKKDIIVKHSANLPDKQEGPSNQFRTYWSRLFASVKKREEKFQLIGDYNNVDWEDLADLIQEEKLMNLSRKRRKFHANLHIQEDNAMKELITSTTVKPNDEIDRLFLGTDDMFNPQGIKEEMLNWLATAHHIVKIHKQDLLYYNILDFTARTGSAGVYTIFKDKYSLAKHHYQSYQNDIDSEAKENCADVKNYVTSIFKHKRKSLCKSLKRAKMQRRRSQTKPKYEKYCLRVLSIYNNLSTRRA
ncbi:hypothetical protein BD408DRAFT_191806 [Parasitella parasitica]|nr:hypothetical protein BD408DRAFT_191806 [Parasitella parasitica]